MAINGWVGIFYQPGPQTVNECFQNTTDVVVQNAEVLEQEHRDRRLCRVLAQSLHQSQRPDRATWPGWCTYRRADPLRRGSTLTPVGLHRP